MSSVSLKGNISGNGVITLESPNTNSDRTISLPDADGTMVYADTSGNVGIGVSSATQKLDVSGTIQSQYNAGSNDSVVGAYNFYNTNSSASSNPIRASIVAGRENSAWGAYLQFNTSTGTSAQAERMRIDSSGNLLVGTTTSPPSAGGVIATKGAGTSTYFTCGSNNLSGTTNFVVYNSSNTGVYLVTGQTSWSANSDSRLKNITGKYETPLADISKIEPVKFTWKSDETNAPKVGVIAQSVIDVVPEAVDKSRLSEEDETEYLSVRYTELVPLLIASVQELNAKVDAQAAEIQALKGVA